MESLVRKNNYLQRFSVHRGKNAAKLWAKRLTAYHRLHLKHPTTHSVLLAGLKEHSRKQTKKEKCR